MSEQIPNEQEMLQMAHEEMAELRAENEKLMKDYMELIYAVAAKFPDEARHDTALRYIQEAETGSLETAQVTKTDE